jgi:hypothetical protein
MRSRLLKCSLALLMLDALAIAHAGTVELSGFETGLAGWNTTGDVSVQTAAIGLAPAQGSAMAFVTTMASAENPYSGTASPNDTLTREFLGLPGGIPQFMAAMPAVDPVGPGGGILEPPVVGEGGAMTYRFYAAQAGVLTFDWNRIGQDSDSAFMTLFSDDGSIRSNDWIYYANSYAGGFSPSGVDVCSHQSSWSCADPAAIAFYNSQTGWNEKSVDVLAPGWYTLGIGVGEIAEGTAPTVLAVDDLRFTASVPEPSALAMMAFAAAALWVRRLRRGDRA